MVVYRITHKKWAETLQASGYPARWNSSGFFVLYTSESMALACLENLVHRQGVGLNSFYEVMHILIPDTLQILKIEEQDLKGNWNDLSEKGSIICRKIGDAWLRSMESCLLRVPSVIIPSEYNILINCNHKDFSKISILKHHPFSFDARL